MTSAFRTWANHSAIVVRVALVTVAHEFRRDLERGVYSRQTLVLAGFLFASGGFAAVHREWLVSPLSVGFGCWLLYGVARGDRRWRDDTRREP